jgi:integrase
MAKRNLTDRALKALKPAKSGKRYDIMDAVVPGLGVRVSDTGQRSFVLVTRFPGAKNPTRRAIGNYGAVSLEAARTKARQWLQSIQAGVDPGEQEARQRAAELRARQNSFAAVCEDFIRDKLSTERCGKQVEVTLRNEFISRWAALPVSKIAKDDVREVIKAAKERGSRYQARNLLTLARRLFQWAIDQDCYGLENSPCNGLKPKALAGEKKARQRILDDIELKAFWRAAGAMKYPYGPFHRMLALTGQRLSEVAEARWREFDLKKKLWTIPAERMKSDAAHVVPLSDDVIKLLETLPRFASGDYLFSSRFGIRPISGFSAAKRQLDAAMTAELGDAFGEFRAHDIRRSMRTHLSALPVPDLVRELCIAHTKPGLHRVYDQWAYLDEKRRAFDLWAARLRSIIGDGPPENVIQLAR